MPEFKKFLQRAIASQRTDIELQIITNATNLNAEYCELLGHFKNVNVTVSVDGFDQVNRYIRWPSNWATMVENIHRLHTITPHISFNVTVSMWNVTRLKELIDFLDAEFNVPIILMNPAVPIPANKKDINTSPFNFPDRGLAVKRLLELKETTSYKQEKYFRGQVEFLINGANTTECNLNDLKIFFEYNDQLDNSRNVQLKDYIPELEQCRDKITKQILNTNAE
jgi:sulfatase maturation enzyme AslB (radical SAM superfamily)